IPFLRILIKHLNYNHLPKSIFKEKSTIVVLFQNPKDTTVSFFHFHNNRMQSIPCYSSRDEFFSEFMTDLWGSCFDPAVTWNKHTEDKNTMWVTPFFRGSILQISLSLYCFQNLTASVKQIAAFFGFSPTAEQIQAIAGRHSFQPVSVKAQETHGTVGLILFRKDIFGDWKNVFAEAQNQKLAAKFTVCLDVAKLRVKFKFGVYYKA
ncbi:ST6B1 Sulfotransferase, partial [Chloropsis hardwickii]|nr:ST6B1 Sulfotransferase [Chloropsis hardwickii]